MSNFNKTNILKSQNKQIQQNNQKQIQQNNQIKLKSILQEFNDVIFILTNKKSDIDKIINQLYLDIQKYNLNENEIVNSVIAIYNKLKLYIVSINIPLFISISKKWNIHKISFDISNFLSIHLSSRISNKQIVNNIINIYLHDLIQNIEYALSNFDKVLINLEKSKFNIITNPINNKNILPSKYKLNNINDKTELETKFKLIMDDLFYILRTLISSSSEHLNKLNDRYKNNLVMFIQKYLPYQFYKHIIDVAECCDMYLKCINLKYIISETEKINLHSIDYDLRNFIKNTIFKNNMEEKENAFIDSVLNKLKFVFDAIDYILIHPRDTLENAKLFIEIDNEELKDIF